MMGTWKSPISCSADRNWLLLKSQISHFGPSYEHDESEQEVDKKKSAWMDGYVDNFVKLD